jgi:hypothetical protein
VSTAYADFLATKQTAAIESGPQVEPDDVHSKLFDWQATIVAWAVRTGRPAIWQVAVDNMHRAEMETRQGVLFTGDEVLDEVPA